MAFGSIELTTISRAQDYSTIKQNEDNKALLSQTNGQIQVQKREEQQTREVHSSDDTQWYQKQPDAREKGNGEYYGDGGQKRQKEKVQSKEQVIVKKNSNGFDIRI